MIKSIKQDLSIRIGLVIFCISTLIGIIYYSYSIHHQNLAFNNFTKQHTKDISEILTLQLWVFDFNTTRDLCLLFSQNLGVSGLRLLDHKKGIIFEKNIPDEETTVHVSKELRYEGKKLVGYLDIYYTDSPWQQQRKSAITIGIIIVIGTILGSLIIIHFLLKHYLSRPLENLQKSMSLLAQGQFKKSKLSTQKTEVQNIINAFNNLATALKQRDVEISQKTYNLEIEIKERKQTEKLLHSSKEQWEKTFNAMNDAVTIQDSDMRILQANKATLEFFQLKEEDVIGKYCYELFQKQDFPCQECPQNEAARKLQTYASTMHYPKLGKSALVTFSPAMDENGELEHFVHTAKDITQQKKLENELIQAHKMEAIGTLAGGIAHDFNNILAAILGYSEMVKDDLPVGSHTRNDINQVISAADRAKELVRQILTFSRKGVETSEPLQLELIIKDTLKLVRASLPTTVEIQESITPDCGSILANSTNIHQVLVNLCTNAFHAMKEEQGIITVKLAPLELTRREVMHETGVSEGSFVELTVRDNGCGMDKNTISRIFEPYFTTKEVGKGTGMGLALIHGIVQSCGGFIKIKSDLGRGTAFHVYFPAITEKSVAVQGGQAKSFPGGDERIMAVDDEKIIASMYQGTLSRLGYTVTTYNSSEEALEVFRSSPDSFDLIITDQTMPNLSGTELTRKILQIRKKIPVILCTGYSTMVSEEKATEVGVDRFVMKPVSRSDLATVVREVLDNRKSAATHQKETAEQ